MTRDRATLGATLRMYQHRAGLTDQAVGEAAYPDISPGAARQKFRRRRMKEKASITQDEAAALGMALGVPPSWLGSTVVWTLVSDGRRASRIYDDPDRAMVDALAAEDQGKTRPGVCPMTEREYLDEMRSDLA